MLSIDHYHEAVRNLQRAQNADRNDQSIYLAAAQVHATLYLALVTKAADTN